MSKKLYLLALTALLAVMSACGNEPPQPPSPVVPSTPESVSESSSQKIPTGLAALYSGSMSTSDWASVDIENPRMIPLEPENLSVRDVDDSLMLDGKLYLLLYDRSSENTDAHILARFDAENGKLLNRVECSAVSSLALTPDNHLAVLGNDLVIRYYDESLKPAGELKLDGLPSGIGELLTEPVQSPHLSADGSRILTVDKDWLPVIYNIAEDRLTLPNIEIPDFIMNECNAFDSCGVPGLYYMLGNSYKDGAPANFYDIIYNAVTDSVTAYAPNRLDNTGAAVPNLIDLQSGQIYQSDRKNFITLNGISLEGRLAMGDASGKTVYTFAPSNANGNTLTAMLPVGMSGVQPVALIENFAMARLYIMRE